MWFVKKTVKEQISKEVATAQLRWEKDRLAELAQYRKVWEDAKTAEIQELHKKYENVIEEKNKVIIKLNKRINDQKKSFQKFKELAVQNEILSTELATESEAFLQLASRVVSCFSLLQFRAETVNKKIEKKERKDIVLQEMEISSVDVEILESPTDRLSVRRPANLY